MENMTVENISDMDVVIAVSDAFDIDMQKALTLIENVAINECRGQIACDKGLM